ncbi:TPA: hypothetical protein I9Y43_004281 [Kluyvera ascorbata]|nr:hypothetical protein [Kluyvera ascorbata]
MAAVSLDYRSSSAVFIDNIYVFDTQPKIENHIGDIPYSPEMSGVLSLSQYKKHPESCLGLKIFSIALVLLFGVIVGLSGGNVMYYIPLYAALAPVLYWLLKIGYAYYVVKAQKMHVDSKAFCGKNND